MTLDELEKAYVEKTPLVWDPLGKSVEFGMGHWSVWVMVLRECPRRRVVGRRLFMPDIEDVRFDMEADHLRPATAEELLTGELVYEP